MYIIHVGEDDSDDSRRKKKKTRRHKLVSIVVLFLFRGFLACLKLPPGYLMWRKSFLSKEAQSLNLNLQILRCRAVSKG